MRSWVVLLGLLACNGTAPVDTAQPVVDSDGDTYAEGVDCDDANSAVHPDAVEVCDGVDNNCDGVVDEADGAGAYVWYTDADGDGVGDAASGQSACAALNGTSQVTGDCDDANPAIHPGAPETDCADATDYNCDGSVGFADADGDSFAACVECDDTDPDVHPGATEVVYDGRDNDCDPSTRDDDLDSDGFLAANDCDDHNAAIRPSATEVPYDGVDNDCSAATPDDDLDRDGYAHAADCDDLDAAVHPGATEVLYDGVDNDCDPSTTDGGPVRDVYSLQPGELVITEIMPNPAAVADNHGEWFEVYNTSADPLNLQGLEVYDLGGATFTVGRRLVAAPHQYVVFGADGDATTNGGQRVDYVYGTFNLANTSDEVYLRVGTTVIDGVGWDNGATFPKSSGASMQLDPGQRDATANDAGEAWCDGTQPYGAGDLGTPGAPNDVCPVIVPPPVDADGDTYDVTVDCDDSDPAIHPGAAEVCGDSVDNNCDGAVDEGCAPPSPFDSGVCTGTPMSASDATALLGGNTQLTVASATIQTRYRSDPAGVWGAPYDWTVHYLTYSGGVTTRYQDLLASMNLVLYSDAGTPKISIQHTSFAGSPYTNADGMVYAFPPVAPSYSHVRAYNHTPWSSSDYLKLDYSVVGGTLTLGAGCAQWTANVYGQGGPPYTQDYAVVFRWN